MSVYKIAKVFPTNSSVIQMEYNKTGDFLLSAQADKSISLIDCINGRINKKIFVKNTGVSCISSTHHAPSILFGTEQTKDYSLANLSLYDNRILRVFKGHTKKVLCINISPINDTFMSTAIDNTLRLWDIKSSNCIAILSTEYLPYACFDPEGLIFAITCQNNTIKLYDYRNYAHGPFASFKFKSSKIYQWCSIAISRDGKMILARTKENVILLIDSFNGKILNEYNLKGEYNKTSLQGNASLSPDCRHVSAGNSDGDIFIWNTSENEQCEILKNHMMTPIVYWNPSKMQMATAEKDIALWVVEEG